MKILESIGYKLDDPEDIIETSYEYIGVGPGAFFKDFGKFKAGDRLDSLWISIAEMKVYEYDGPDIVRSESFLVTATIPIEQIGKSS